jgi:hypothetical protein
MVTAQLLFSGQCLMSFAHPDTMKILLLTLFFSRKDPKTRKTRKACFFAALAALREPCLPAAQPLFSGQRLFSGQESVRAG